MSLLFAVSLILFLVNGEDVTILDDSNFEKLTQASTGHTTGDWFIKFYAPWCGHCKRLEPTWNELGTKLKNKINVAKIDCTTNRGTAKRFGIRGFPTLILLRGGKMIKYEGKRTVTELIKFTEIAEANEDIPGPPGALDKVLTQSLTTVEETIRIFETQPISGALLLGLGGLFGFLIGAIICSGPPQPQRMRMQDTKKTQ